MGWKMHMEKKGRHFGRSKSLIIFTQGFFYYGSERIFMSVRMLRVDLPHWNPDIFEQRAKRLPASWVRDDSVSGQVQLTDDSNGYCAFHHWQLWKVHTVSSFPFFKHLIIFPFLCGTFFSYWKLQTNIDIYKNFNFSVLGR